MKKYIYQVNGDYFTIEAESLQDAMFAVVGEHGVVIGEYTHYAYLFNE